VKSSPSDKPPENVIYVHATAEISNIPVNDPDFGLIFTSSVLSLLEDRQITGCSVTLFSVSSSTRRSSSTRAEFRVEAPSSSVSSSRELTSAIGDDEELASTIQAVGTSVKGSPDAYQNAEVSYAKKPSATTSGASTSSSSSDNTTAIVIGVCAGLGGLVLIVIIIAFILRGPSNKHDADLYTDIDRGNSEGLTNAFVL
jgi:hypothetical protein